MSDHDYASRTALKAKTKAAKLIAAQHADTLRWIMGTPQGRWWVYDLLEICHIGHTPFTGEALTTAHQCGEQGIGLRLWAELQSACPDLYLLMMQEYNAREVANAAREQYADDGSDDTDNVNNGFGNEPNNRYLQSRNAGYDG